MGGEGSMMAMITSLRNNSRRKSRTQFDKDATGGYGEGKKVEFDFPEVTPQVLKAIRDKLQNERRQLMVKTFILVVAVITIFMLLIIF